MANDAIEQADRIVFGDWRLKDRLHNTLHANGLSVDTLRRGAYIEWLMDRNHDDAAKGLFDDIVLMAERIVSIDAAANPKGDELPEFNRVCVERQWSGRNGKFIFSFDPPITDEVQSKAVASHILCCLSKPVRRLLAQYEVHDHDPLQGVMTRVCQHRGDPIYLVPKAVKP